jgi:hypothetical protein
MRLPDGTEYASAASLMLSTQAPGDVWVWPDLPRIMEMEPGPGGFLNPDWPASCEGRHWWIWRWRHSQFVTRSKEARWHILFCLLFVEVSLWLRADQPVVAICDGQYHYWDWEMDDPRNFRYNGLVIIVGITRRYSARRCETFLEIKNSCIYELNLYILIFILIKIREDKERIL